MPIIPKGNFTLKFMEFSTIWIFFPSLKEKKEKKKQFCFTLISKRSDECLFEGKLSITTDMQVTLLVLFIILLVTREKSQQSSRVTVERAILPR